MEENENKIDLKRMASLLNGFDGIEKKEDEYFIDFKKYFKSSNNDINVDLYDLLNTLKYKGKIEGYSNISSHKNIIRDITSNINFKNVKNSKATLVLFIMNPNISLFAINELLETVHDSISSKADIVFGSYSDERLKTDELKYFIIYTGIENDISYEADEKYQKLIHENKILREQNERMKNSLLSLKMEKGMNYGR